MKTINKKIRLSDFEVNSIKNLAKEIFGEDIKLWIFGSRANPEAKGGDIDIFIEIENTENILNKQIKYLSKLKLTIGDQKIDLVIKPKNCEEPICIEAKTKGVRLV